MRRTKIICTMGPNTDKKSNHEGSGKKRNECCQI